MPAAALVVVALGVAGCGSENAATAEGGPAKGKLVISSWPDYIDRGAFGTLNEFETETGISVDYREEITDNERFFEKLEPLLEQDDSGGRSVLIVSDWMAKQMYDRGYLQELDHGDLPAVFENMQPSLRSPAFDPERRFSIPWQSDITGIWVNTVKAPAIDSVVEFFDPGIAGKVTMLADMRDSPPLVIMAESKDPLKASTADWLEAINRIALAEKVGQIRSLTGSEYTEGLNSGKLIAAVGRSSDASLIDNPDVKWMIPAQGCVLSSDNMVIPVGAPNTAAALAWMDYVYQPAAAVEITEAVNHVSPVKGIKELREKVGRKLPNAALVSPGEGVTGKCTDQASPPDLEQVSEAWQEALAD